MKIKYNLASDRAKPPIYCHGYFKVKDKNHTIRKLLLIDSSDIKRKVLHLLFVPILVLSFRS